MMVTVVGGGENKSSVAGNFVITVLMLSLTSIDYNTRSKCFSLHGRCI